MSSRPFFGIIRCPAHALVLDGSVWLLSRLRRCQKTGSGSLLSISSREVNLVPGFCLAMRVLHEGDHGVRIVVDGHPGIRAERLDRERHGYRAEGYYQKATGFLQEFNNIWAPWNPGDGMDEIRVEGRANFSVMSSCAGSSEGSCK